VSVSVSVERGVQSDRDSNLGGRQLCFQFTHHDSFEFNLHMTRLHGGLGLKVAHESGPFVGRAAQHAIQFGPRR
jgi:hypothetical protein